MMMMSLIDWLGWPMGSHFFILRQDNYIGVTLVSAQRDAMGGGMCIAILHDEDRSLHVFYRYNEATS